MPQRISGNIKLPLQWTETASAGQNTTSVATRPATPGVVHVCTAIIMVLQSWSITGSGASQWLLLDGATILLQGGLEVNTNLPVSIVNISGLNIPGTAGNSMSVSCSANQVGAPGCASIANLVGYEL